jgi:CRAL/TRIO domain
MLKEVFGFLQNNYRARLYRGYTVNAPWSFSVVWTACKAFVEETTALKINISTKKGDANMWNHMHVSQVE